MLHKLLGLLCRHLGFITLVVILVAITIKTIQPDFYFMGWDNYSSFFNLPTNLFRTFFATWREYRGLGVASDAEVTDIFRQIFFMVTHFVFPDNLLDQLYYLFSLWVGVVSIYGVAHFLFGELGIHHAHKPKWKEVFATLTSLFYLFNLNTLSVFYSPIIPFTNRFYSLPLLLYLFLRVRKIPTFKNYIFLIVAIIVTSGQFITPTVILTSLVALFLFLLFRETIRKSLAYGLIFLCLNSFWILPFINYTIQKSSIISLARTFVEINESSLNRSQSAFNLEKQAELFPSFVDIRFSSLTGASYTLHPLLKEYASISGRLRLLLFPLLYFFGSILILLRFKRNKNLLWIPLWIVIFLFLSLKGYGPLGFLYLFITKLFPLFDVLFRISDTKFHAYISLAGSLAAAYGVIWIMTRVAWKRVNQAVVLIFCVGMVCYIWLFRTYFTGNFIGFFVYTKLPQAYYDVAKAINTAPGNGRVLHLPMDTWHSYWRSYSWGYVGSAFFNFLLDKPYIDKTFEPGSMENSYLHSTVTSLIESFYKTGDPVRKRELAANFVTLLRKTGTQFVLVDNSVDSSVYSRNILYTANQYAIRSQAILAYLLASGDVKRINTYPIDLESIYTDYRKLYPVNQIGLPRELPKQTAIELYEIQHIDLPIRFEAHATNIDATISNLLEVEGELGNFATRQSTKEAGQFLPFLQQNHKVSQDDISVTLGYPNASATTQNLTVHPGDTTKDSYMIDVYGSIKNNALQLSFFHRYYPDINKQKFIQPIGSMSFVLPKGEIVSTPLGTNMGDFPGKPTDAILSDYRVHVNDLILPIPVTVTSGNSYISSYILHEKTIRADLLSKTENKAFDLGTFTVTSPPNCYGPELPGFDGNVAYENGKLSLSALYGSTCLHAALPASIGSSVKPLYGEIILKARGTAQDGPVEKTSSLAKGVSSIGEKPVEGYVCLLDGNNPNCLNSHRMLKATQNISEVRIPLSRRFTSVANLKFQIGSVADSDYMQTLSVLGANIETFASAQSHSLSFSPAFPIEHIELRGPFEVTVPKALSPYSFALHPEHELYFVPQAQCRSDNLAPRIVRSTGIALFNYMNNCSTFFAQHFTYASQYPYLFAFSYWLGSGQQPSIVLGKHGDDYLLERVSLYQGYPNLAGMKQFQNLSPNEGIGSIQKSISTIQLTNASRLLSPLYVADEPVEDAAIHFFQDTDNDGLFALGSFSMLEYPASWQGLSLNPEGSDRSFTVPSSFTFSQILPSLWKLDAKDAANSLLVFNQGYDDQWGLYDSLLGVFFGKSIGAHYSCQGFANCFEIPQSKGSTFYIFYWPERLAIVGWGLTGITFLTVLLACRKTSRNVLAV